MFEKHTELKISLKIFFPLDKNVHNYSVIASIKFFKSCKATKNTSQPCVYKTEKRV